MLGDLPSDFLRIQLVEAQVYGPSLFDQPLEQDSNFLGYLNFSIVEVSFCFFLEIKISTLYLLG